MDSWFDCRVSWCDLTTLPFPLPSWMITSILKVCLKNPWDYHQKPRKLWLRTGSPQSFDPPLHDTNIICKYWNRHSLRSTLGHPPISFPSAWSSLNAWGCRFAEGDSRVLQQMLTRDLVKAHSKFPVAWPFCFGEADSWRWRFVFWKMRMEWFSNDTQDPKISDSDLIFFAFVFFCWCVFRPSKLCGNLFI